MLCFPILALSHAARGHAVAAALTLAALGACAAPAPPTRAPDFEGVVVGRTPRLDAPPTAPRLLLTERPWAAPPGLAAPAPTRVEVELGTGADVLERRRDGDYRHVEASEAWVGRTVRVWYAPATSRGPTAGGAPSRRRAAAVVTDGRDR